MKELLAVFMGGAVGSVVRYLFSLWARKTFGHDFPYGTIGVNVIGSFVMGVLAHLARTTQMLSPVLALALTTGLLGGFTTYSTFNDDTIRLLQSGASVRAALNVGVTLLAGLAAGIAGVVLGRWVASS